MKVGELKAVLQDKPDEMEVVALWDGGWAKLEDFSVETDQDTGAKVLQFDVEEYGTYYHK